MRTSVGANLLESQRMQLLKPLQAHLTVIEAMRALPTAASVQEQGARFVAQCLSGPGTDYGAPCKSRSRPGTG